MANSLAIAQALLLSTVVSTACSDPGPSNDRPVTAGQPRDSTVATFGVADSPFEQAIGEITDVAFDAEDRIVLLDARNHRIQLIRPDGQLVAQFERSGRGPGEFYVPAAVDVGSDGLIYVLDRGNQRVTSLRQERDSLTFVNEFRIEHDARDLCVLRNAVLLVGDYEQQILHYYSVDGQYLRSAGNLEGAPADHPAEHPLYERHFSTGSLLCDLDREEILFAATLHGLLRSFDSEGIEVGRRSLAGFVPVSITVSESGGLSTDYPEGRDFYHRVQNIVLEDDSVVVVQVAAEHRAALGERSRFEYFEYRLHSIDSRVPERLQASRFGAPYFRGRRVVVVAVSEPFPMLRVLSPER
ncbi:MAG: 6-bladed beta-propeller [Longimicrobiales bacterium]